MKTPIAARQHDLTEGNASPGNRIVWFYIWLILLFSAIAMVGCGHTGQSMSAGRADGADLRKDAQGISGRDALRIREDALRNRLWLLTLDEVRIYDTEGPTSRLIREIALPSWSVVGFRNVCMPDIALDASGSAFISSNGQARLLRIDGDSFALTDYEIGFHGKAERDIGFGALAFAADGTLFARTTPGGLLWTIDVARASADAIDYAEPPLNECAFTAQFLKDYWRRE